MTRVKELLGTAEYMNGEQKALMIFVLVKPDVTLRILRMCEGTITLAARPPL